MPKQIARRDFLTRTAFSGITFSLAGSALAGRGPAPSDKLNVAFIGVGGRGRANVDAVARNGENVVALCDVDDERAAPTYKKYPWAKKYHDYRVMFDELRRTIDAVVVSTPDHSHAGPAVMAMRLGKHCYCEKPLSHCIYEGRVMAELARKKRIATQLGTQHHSEPMPRQAVEIVWSGLLGPIRECHVWIGGNRGGGTRPKETPPVPPTLKWDLWLGPRPYRPYHPAYVPYRWRFWWDFGTGETGNNGVHIMDFAFWGLKLGYPLTVEAEGPPVSPETSPRWMHVRYTFPKRGDLPPLTLHFYHTKEGPAVLKKYGLPHWESATLFIGEEGMLLATYSRWKLFPEKKFADYKGPEPILPEPVEHHREWLLACKRGGKPSCHFEYGALLTEIVLLGNVAYRTGKKLKWLPAEAKALGCPEAQPYIKESRRPGWEL